MTEQRRNFYRPTGKRPYKKLFLIATEGTKTEPNYFAIFNEETSVVRVKCLIGGIGKNAPSQVLKRIQVHIKKETIKSSDEAWLVIDKDRWTNEQLKELHEWSKKQKNYGLALSNPKFEYWLLLHYEDGNGISSPRDCTERLKRWIPNYDKGIDIRKITRQQINYAIQRAKTRNQPPCMDWPQTIGTTVYLLIEKIITK